MPLKDGSRKIKKDKYEEDVEEKKVSKRIRKKFGDDDDDDEDELEEPLVNTDGIVEN